MPNCTLEGVHKKEAPEVKVSMEQVMMLGCVNATGQHKLKPVLIGKYHKPRCFNHVTMEALPVPYTAQQNSWMNSDIFECWFRQISAQL